MNLEDLYRLLRSGHVQAQGIVDTMDAPLLVLDSGLVVVSANRAFFAAFKVGRDETIGRPLLSLGDGQWDIPDLRRLLLEVIPKSAAVVGYEVTHEFPEVGLRTILLTARRLVHPDDTSNTMLVVFEDVTGARHAAAEKDILLEETRHRMKNLIATVRAVASQTQTAGRSAEEYKQAFLGRFKAILDAQDISLSSAPVQDLETLVHQATDALRERIAIGPAPSVTLPRSSVGSLGLILHELTTNAMKYGALSHPDGIVRIGWDIVDEQGRRTLRLNWREENGPAPPARIEQGFGSRLVAYGAQSLGGAAKLVFEPTGCRMKLTFPLDREAP